IPLLSAAALMGSLAIFEEAGIGVIRRKSLAQTDYLIGLIEGMGLCEEPYGYRIGTPREHVRRGGHVAIEHDEGARIALALKERGFIVDFRQPDVVRLAPIALYTTYHEVWQVAHALREIIDTGAHRTVEASGPVS
ncbi:MAG: kynureninase, partial [Chloroflexota bacterium]|nr:kynureninase [Chloroflexota bacterium]